MYSIFFGVIIPQGWLNDLPNTNAHKQFELAKNIATTTEKLGYASIWTYDHFVPHYSYEPLETKPLFECYTLLSALASITNKVKLGQVVTCNSYRHPSLLAKMGATLDAISNGRLELGIGAGWYEEEYVAYGYQYPKDSERIERLDEALHIIKAMWTDVKASYSGKYYSIKEAICNPKPLQKPYPPIMVGGSGEKLLLRIAAKHANRYNHPFGTPEELKRKVEVLKEHCKSIGRDHKEIEKSVLIRVVVANSDKEIKQIVRKVKNKEESVEQYLYRNKDKMVIGTPEQVLADLNKYIQHEVTHFILHFMGIDSSKMLRLFASKVMKKI
ncbi:MAG: LLM class F420-dependent oxidoreductase [Thaumarchaeota archaeon]|nr:LLM class F420-dependent oxidoreductase [Nitrososphaerota archaeon]